MRGDPTGVLPALLSLRDGAGSECIGADMLTDKRLVGILLVALVWIFLIWLDKKNPTYALLLEVAAIGIGALCLIGILLYALGKALLS